MHAGSNLTSAQKFLSDLREQHVQYQFAARDPEGTLATMVVRMSTTGRGSAGRYRPFPHEHIYWDQASVLVQLGLLDASPLPIAGVEAARKTLDPNLPSNRLIEHAPKLRRPTR